MEIENLIGNELINNEWTKLSDSFTQWLDRLEQQKGITIIIPVYNGVESVKNLLQSIINVSEAANIILVDDCSTDVGINQVCSSFLKKWDDALVVKNKTNLGYVKSANVGIEEAPEDHDIVLLNSDTIVTSNWLTKLKNTAYSYDNVATVCPLSNAAGIYSIPYPKQQNILEPNWTPEMHNQLLNIITPIMHEKVPSTSGFCCYLRRSAINAIGMLDELLFDHGYAEDNDYCIRAEKEGLINVVAANTFVFHEREASFGKNKAQLKKQNSRILKALFPEHQSSQLNWEENTALNELWNQYPNYSCLENKLKTLTTENVTKIIVLEDKDNHRGKWNSKERSLTLKNNGDHATVDLFGLRQVTVRLNHKNFKDLAIYLSLRWQAINCKEHNINNI